MKNNQDISWRWPVTMIFARFILALFLQLILAGIYFTLKDQNPLQSAGRWFTVYGSLIDLGCLILINRQLRMEGVKIRDLLNIQRDRIGKDLLTGLLYALLFLPVSMIGTVASTYLFYGTFEPMQIMGGLPLWGALFSVLIFPLLWGFTEQLTYMGYSLQRLERILNHKWLVIALVSFGWMLQHAALPFSMDVSYAAMRMLSFLPLTILMPLIYLRTKRLLPFIMAHWIMDLIAAIIGTLLPLLIE